MKGFKSLNKLLEEPVLTRLVSADGFESSKIETWQPNRFDLNAPKEEVGGGEKNHTHEGLESEEGIESNVKSEAKLEAQQKVEIFKKETYDLAYKEGYQSGLEQGINEGAEQGRMEAKELALKESRDVLSPKLVELDALLLMLKQPYNQLEKQVFSELTELALHVAQTVIKKEVSAHKEWVLEAIEEAVYALPDEAKSFSIELHPEDLVVLKALNHAPASEWDVTENNALLQGTCLVKQGNSSVLNSWKTRFDDVAGHLDSSDS